MEGDDIRKGKKDRVKERIDKQKRLGKTLLGYSILTLIIVGLLWSMSFVIESNNKEEVQLDCTYDWYRFEAKDEMDNETYEVLLPHGDPMRFDEETVFKGYAFSNRFNDTKWLVVYGSNDHGSYFYTFLIDERSMLKVEPSLYDDWCGRGR